jgi:hypothetical protein
MISIEKVINQKVVDHIEIYTFCSCAFFHLRLLVQFENVEF